MTTVISLNYIEIPVLAQLLIPVRVVTPMVYAGPSFAFKAGKPTVKIDGENLGIDKDFFSSFDFGIVFGCGVGVKAGPGNAVFDVRYTLGLSKIRRLTDEDKAKGATESNIPKIENGALVFAVGYLFTF